MKLEYYSEYVDAPVGKSHLELYRNHGKLALLRGEDTAIRNSAREGYISAKMCLAAQRSIEEQRMVDVELHL